MGAVTLLVGCLHQQALTRVPSWEEIAWWVDDLAPLTSSGSITTVSAISVGFAQNVIIQGHFFSMTLATHEGCEFRPGVESVPHFVTVVGGGGGCGMPPLGLLRRGRDAVAADLVWGTVPAACADSVRRP